MEYKFNIDDYEKDHIDVSVSITNHKVLVIRLKEYHDWLRATKRISAIDEDVIAPATSTAYWNNKTTIEVTDDLYDYISFIHPDINVLNS